MMRRRRPRRKGEGEGEGYGVGERKKTMGEMRRIMRDRNKWRKWIDGASPTL